MLAARSPCFSPVHQIIFLSFTVSFPASKRSQRKFCSGCACSDEQTLIAAFKRGHHVLGAFCSAQKASTMPLKHIVPVPMLVGSACSTSDCRSNVSVCIFEICTAFSSNSAHLYPRFPAFCLSSLFQVGHHSITYCSLRSPPSFKVGCPGHGILAMCGSPLNPVLEIYLLI